MIIQNAASIAIPINTGNNRHSLKNDKVYPRHFVRNIVVFRYDNGFNPGPIPPGGVDYFGKQDLSLYFNLSDTKGKSIVESLAFENLIFEPDKQDYIEIPVNAFIDFNQSYLEYKFTGRVSRYNYVLLIIYDSRKPRLKHIREDATLTVSSDFNFGGVDPVSLYSLFGNKLKNKMIKQLHYNSFEDISPAGTIHIVGKHGEVIEDIPVALFRNRDRRVYLDNIIIDYEKSFYKHIDFYQRDFDKIDFTLIF